MRSYTKSINWFTLALQCVNNIHGGHCLSLQGQGFKISKDDARRDKKTALFTLACSVYVTASRMVFSRNARKTCRVSCYWCWRPHMLFCYLLALFYGQEDRVRSSWNDLRSLRQLAGNRLGLSRTVSALPHLLPNPTSAQMPNRAFFIVARYLWLGWVIFLVSWNSTGLIPHRFESCRRRRIFCPTQHQPKCQIEPFSVMHGSNLRVIFLVR